MRKLMLIVPLCLSACIPFYVAVPVGLVTAIPADHAANYAMGGSIHHTITGEDSISRDQGNEYASFRCSVYDPTLSWYDELYFSESSYEQFHKVRADHCKKWEMYENGELDSK